MSDAGVHVQNDAHERLDQAVVELRCSKDWIVHEALRVFLVQNGADPRSTVAGRS